MYQNYNGIHNPLEKHFQMNETIRKRSNTMVIIASFAFGVLIGIIVYRCIKAARDDEDNFTTQKKED